MKLLFEVLKFTFELLYASYEYEIRQITEDYTSEATADTDTRQELQE